MAADADEREDSITRLLRRAGSGDREAIEALYPQIYAELRAIARGIANNASRTPTLSPTALVNEAWLKLADKPGVEWHDRLHFFRYAARAMRHVLIDYARSRGAAKRGSGAAVLELNEAIVADADTLSGLLALDDAVRHLDAINPRLGQVVELRVFGGLDLETVARTLDVDPRTVSRDWRKARAILHEMLEE